MEVVKGKFHRATWQVLLVRIVCVVVVAALLKERPGVVFRKGGEETSGKSGRKRVLLSVKSRSDKEREMYSMRRKERRTSAAWSRGKNG